MILLPSSQAMKLLMESDDPGLVDHWYLVDTHGQKFRLPKTMLFLGREECDVVVASQSVDKRHAVLTFDLYLNRFKVKDLSTSNGTYVNNSRIPEQEYVTLNHMDSVRLGHDAMMYHVEQGSQITGQGGQLPDPSFVPAWATHRQQQHQHPQYHQQASSTHHPHHQGEPQLHIHGHNMAECQGCIAEQNIEHSCGLRHEPGLHDDHVHMTSTPPLHLNHPHHHHPPHYPKHLAASPSSPHSSSSPSYRSSKSSPLSSDSDHPHHPHHHQQYNNDYHSASPGSDSAPQQEARDSTLHHQCGDNSVEKPSHKLARPSSSASVHDDHHTPSPKPPSSKKPPEPPHGDGGDANAAEDDDDGLVDDDLTPCDDRGQGEGEESGASTTAAVTTSGPGRNTWPRKRTRPAVPHVSSLFSEGNHVKEEVGGSGSEAKPAASMGGMFFVAFDDSVCNTTTAEVQRRPRNSTNPLPPELATVKKGTPLYGQPSWWGEDDDDEVDGKKELLPGPSGDAHAQTGKAIRSRPNSLSLSGDEADLAAGKISSSTSSGTEKVPNRRMNGAERIKPTYMEIPIRDEVEEKAKGGAKDSSSGQGKKDGSKSASSTPAKSITSSLSKDSLLDSPDARQTSGTTKPSVEAATSFTVDLSDPSDPQRKSAKAVTMAASLSQYVPSKIRRGFRDRQERAGSHAKNGSSSRGSTPSKYSEERELSPAQQPTTTSVQAKQQQQHQHNNKKLEEMWSVVESGGGPGSGAGGKVARQAGRLSSTQATAGSVASSLRSPNLEEIERLSGDNKTARGKRSSTSPQVSRNSTSRTKANSTVKGAGVVAAVAQYADSTSYLIDKMFEGGSSSGIGGSASVSSASSDTSQVTTEKQLYREAAANDRTKRAVTAANSSSSKQAGRQVKSSPAKSKNTGVPNRRSSASSGGKPATQKSSTSSSSSSKMAVGASATTTSNALKSTSKKQASPLSPTLKVCDNGDDSDNENNNDAFVVDDDLQIREDNEASSSAVGSAAGTVGDGEVSDKASEAGTYVIEAGEGEEGEEEEEAEARRKIDEVFGVDKTDPLRLTTSPGGYDNVYDDDDDDDGNDLTMGAEGDEEDADGDKTPLDGISPLEDDFEDDTSGIEEPSMTSTTDGVQTWMTQLNALTSGGHRQAALSADDRQAAKEEGEKSMSRKPPHSGGSSKRPGTGRKLPSIPTTDRSPVSSDHGSSCVLDPTDSVVDGQAGWSAASSQLNGHRTSIQKTNSGSPASSGHSSKPHARNGVSANGRLVSSPGSARSRGSVDTELLLQDTETVMAAMEARMAYRTAGHGRADSIDDDERVSVGDSDTDVSSTVALVNGDEDYVKPSYYTSPRDALRSSGKHQDARRSLGRTSGTSANNTSSAQLGKRPLVKSYSQTVSTKVRTPSSSNGSPRTPTSIGGGHRRSVGSDVYSGRDSVGADSLASDVGSENGGDGSLSRSSSRGKGTMSMTKPNRAFQLRRARSDSVEENTPTPTTPRSGAKTGVSSARSAGGSSVRSSSVHSSNRARLSGVDTNRSEATSLGAQIARKSRANGATMQDSDSNKLSTNGVKASSSSNLHRQDGGRHSLRLNRASSLTISSPSQSTCSSGLSTKRETAPTASSINKTRTTPTGSRGNLTITGVSTSGGNRSQSQPGSRSNSPKAAERIAWRRRKEYDPRRAVAEAKAAKAAKDTSGPTTNSVTMRPKPHSGAAAARANRRMIRSASFTNTGGELALSLAGSVSASQELVPGLPSASDYSGDSTFRRAFLPFQAVSGRLGGHHSAHSADEDDTSPGSLRASYDTLIVSSIYQLSSKLVSNTDKSLHKLRDQSRVSHSPSPCDDFLNDSCGGRGEMTAFRSANQELAGVLNNLRRLERHVHVLNSVLFPEDEDMVPTQLSATGSLPSPSSTKGSTAASSKAGTKPAGKQRYFAEIERIRNELAGFHPIGGAQVPDNEVDSPEMAELSEQF